MINFLSSFLTNPWILVGGAAVLLIPIIIHLLNRRRFDVVDWGAMQFLQISENVRRRLLIEELLLMLLRIGLLGVLVFAIAGPFGMIPGWWPKSLSSARQSVKKPHDVVFVIDGSASMLAHGEEAKPPIELAKTLLRETVDGLMATDAVAVILAREQPVTLLELSVDRARLKKVLDELSPAAGSSNLPDAVTAASQLLEKSQKPQREVVILTDHQRTGLADTDVLARWQSLATQLAKDDKPRPRISMVNLASERPARLPNWGLGPITSNRPITVVGREVQLKCDVTLHGLTRYRQPHRIRFEVDGAHVRDLKLMKNEAAKDADLPVPNDGRVNIPEDQLRHRFTQPGSHLVSIILEPDPPLEQQPPGYQAQDRVPGDNRQDFSVEVLEALPVLIVDGEISDVGPQQQRNSDFIRDALSPARDKSPTVKATVVSVRDFTPQMLVGEQRPRALILHDVARLEGPVALAVTDFIAEGGGVLVTLGARAEAEWYNQVLFRAGEGWLPAKLETLAGDENNPNEVMRPDPLSFTHPALALFRGLPVGGLNEAKFLRYWKLTTPEKGAAGVVAGTMRNQTARLPFVVERDFRAGRVMLSSIPLDNSWGTNVTELASFVPLVHEMIYYLAGARSAEFNLKAGQPIRYAAAPDVKLEGFTLQPPVGDEKKLTDVPGERNAYQAKLLRREREALVDYSGTHLSGVYRLTTPSEQTIYYVVPSEGREADLTPSDEADLEKLSKFVEMGFAKSRTELLEMWGEGKTPEEWWWLLLVALLGLLCLEVWMTRRMVMNR